MREANKMRELELEKVHMLHRKYGVGLIHMYDVQVGAVEEEGEEIDVMEYNV